MTVAELTDYWWLLPLLLIVVCCLACGKGCGCTGRRLIFSSR